MIQIVTSFYYTAFEITDSGQMELTDYSQHNNPVLADFVDWKTIERRNTYVKSVTGIILLFFHV